jgi:hypothetical protein
MESNFKWDREKDQTMVYRVLSLLKMSKNVKEISIMDDLTNEYCFDKFEDILTTAINNPQFYPTKSNKFQLELPRIEETKNIEHKPKVIEESINQSEIVTENYPRIDNLSSIPQNLSSVPQNLSSMPQNLSNCISETPLEINVRRSKFYGNKKSFLDILDANDDKLNLRKIIEYIALLRIIEKIESPEFLNID